MCGRFALGIPRKRLEEVFGASMPDTVTARYNVAPGQDALAVCADGLSRAARWLRWGLVPGWADDPKIGNRMINARSETVFDKPAFREPIRSTRCLVPAQAFYEWKREDGVKTPFAMGLKDADVFALAGIAASWSDARTGEAVDSFAVLTCAPNALMADIHDRMPVILPPESWGRWLDGSVSDRRVLSAMLVPYPAGGMRAWPVSGRVNSPANDGPDLLEKSVSGIPRQGRLL